MNEKINEIVKRISNKFGIEIKIFERSDWNEIGFKVAKYLDIGSDKLEKFEKIYTIDYKELRTKINDAQFVELEQAIERDLKDRTKVNIKK